MTHEEQQQLDAARRRTAVGRMLDEFEEVVWPVYRERGFSLDAAMLAYAIDGVAGAIYDLTDEIADDGPFEGDEWKRGT